jgi:protein-S-isoprenylcysteine O-methyltransferase Ste14
MPERFRWRWVAPILLYAASAMEIFIMISPFAAYFYSVYTPLLHGLTQFQATAWLSRFFLPHLAKTDSLLFTGLWYLGPILAGIGVIGFIACAVQLYYGKFVRKRLVHTGLYGRVRHPQYLCLAVAGAGFLLMWPRFFILIMYLTMLGLYYLLARHEEEAILQKYGKEGEAYMARIAMFNPFRAPSTAGRWQPPARWKALAVWTIMTTVSLGLAFFMRHAAVKQVHAVRRTAPNVTAISFASRPPERISAITEAVLATPEVQRMLKDWPDETYLVQIATGAGEIRHLMTDLGMKAGAVQAIPFFDREDYVVMSRLLSGDAPAPDPFALDVRLEPILLARPDGSDDRLDVRAFIPEQFYPDFARVMF